MIIANKYYVLLENWVIDRGKDAKFRFDSLILQIDSEKCARCVISFFSSKIVVFVFGIKLMNEFWNKRVRVRN